MPGGNRLDGGPEAMEGPDQIVVFTLDGRQIALPLTAVERVVRAVEVTPLPKAPDVILGIVNVQGRILPVFNLRRRFRMPERDIELGDHMLIASTARRTVALLADSVTGVVAYAGADAVPPEAIADGIGYVQGVIKRPDGLVFIHDIETFLSPAENRQLEEALTP
jgi:purine-binding chemotaxis protein CheW